MHAASRDITFAEGRNQNGLQNAAIRVAAKTATRNGRYGDAARRAGTGTHMILRYNIRRSEKN